MILIDYDIVVIEKQDIFTIMGGRVKIYRGPYNLTSDAVWLAAFIDGAPKTVLDVGTGTGAVALCLLSRMPNIKMTVMDISETMLNAARKNFELNNQNAEFINADIMSWHTSRTFDLVITNTPYLNGTPAAHNAHHIVDLGKWAKKCIARVKPNGIFATIVDATNIGPIIAEMAQHCGDFHILPLFSTKDTAERVLLSCRVGRAPTTTLYSGLSMNCDGVLRDGLPVSGLIDKMNHKR